MPLVALAGAFRSGGSSTAPGPETGPFCRLLADGAWRTRQRRSRPEKSFV